MAVDITGLPLTVGFRALQIDAVDPVAAQAYVDQWNNLTTLTGKAATAIANNVAYLGIGAPTNAQVVAQVQALTRQLTALMRLASGALDSTAGS